MKTFKFIILSLIFILASCANSTNNNDTPTTAKTTIPRNQWDAENIAYENIGNPSVTYPYLRKSGSTGIIGTFEESHFEKSKMTGSVYIYNWTFSETGYFEYSSKSAKYQYHDSGTFTIYKSSKTSDYYIVKTTSNEGHGYNWYFYQVTNDKLDLQPYIVKDSVAIYPEKSFYNTSLII